MPGHEQALTEGGTTVVVRVGDHVLAGDHRDQVRVEGAEGDRRLDPVEEPGVALVHTRLPVRLTQEVPLALLIVGGVLDLRERVGRDLRGEGTDDGHPTLVDTREARHLGLNRGSASCAHDAPPSEMVTGAARTQQSQPMTYVRSASAKTVLRARSKVSRSVGEKISSRR